MKNQDTLTKLPNRAFFNEVLNKALVHAKRHNKICAVLIIDIDAFKNANNTLGENFGNEVLNKIAQRLTQTLRTDDFVAHLEGDSFIVLLNDINKSKFASVVAEKILKNCSNPIKDFSFTVSIGISIYPNDGLSMEDMLKNADAALYKAKNSGGNQYQFHTHEMDMEAREFIKLENELRLAIEKNELVLYYQPKLHIKKGSITGVEALLRWAHPELGILNPSQFISIAEDTGLIMKIGEWALREACKANKHWQNEGYEHFTVALNLSPKQFYHPDITKIIENVLKETGLNPKYLELEINESTVMNNTTNAKNQLDAIKSLGIQLSVDHFGVGYTSISHLKQFPVSTIKIDQNYIKGIPNNPDDSAITNAFIALAHNLGLEVVAEGVETAEQVQYLTLQNCDMVQGYFLSHPLPAEKIELQFKKLMDRALF
ncbi:MAG TPA: bifunctional diguanylate cyclase/phosphodiesterase [Gammaproteobacteria bacterium]|nr:bifunctional diguanylate cyclase/phosphodiesterase [Gammaproteobacteria bacterium]